MKAEPFVVGWQPGCLDDGTPVGYAWGMGIRSHAGHRVYRHGGGWPGIRALLARVPDLDLSLVILALADNSERRVDLAASMLDLLIADTGCLERAGRISR